MRVVFVTAILNQYRVPFHERARLLLANHGIAYELIQGQPDSAEAAKGDLSTLPWSIRVRNSMFGFGLSRAALWQPITRHIRGADLVVLGQENRLLVNYVLQMMPRGRRPKIAHWGHGRNFQARDRDSLSERWKRFWATKVDWWFGYTDETRRHIESLGFPPARITVFNNAVDTQDVRDMAAAVDEPRLASLRAQLGLSGQHVGIFVGGLYADKRLAFLVEAAEQVRAAIPDFELLVVGGGVELPLMRELAATRPWIKVTGPKFGAEKIELMRLAQLFLMPGLVGLAILDAAAAGLPTVTTAFPWHSPEIAYLESGVNGMIVEDWENPQAYGDAIAALLRDPVRLAEMSAAAARMADERTIDAMAENFSRGVLRALELQP